MKRVRTQFIRRRKTRVLFPTVPAAYRRLMIIARRRATYRRIDELMQEWRREQQHAGEDAA